MRQRLRAWIRRGVRALVGRVWGLGAVNALHRRLSPALRQRFFHLTIDENWRVAGDWLVDFAGRTLVLPLRRDFPLAWTAAVGFHGYDPELHELYASLVKSPSPPRVFFDVGANYGLHSLRLLAHGVRVLSFEPNHACHDFFLACCRANGLSPEIVPAAVGAATGWATMTVPLGRTYLGSIVPGLHARYGSDVETFEVPLVSLDDFVDQRRVAPDLLKIDVEGAELQVLLGARGLLAHARPVVIFESWWSTAERRDVFDFLASLNYGIRTMVSGGHAPELSHGAFLGCRDTNFVAWPTAGCLAAQGVHVP